MKESTMWREIARKFAEGEFPSPVMRTRLSHIRVGDAVMEMYDEGRIPFTQTKRGFDRISHHDGSGLGPKNDRGVNVLAALMLAIEAEEEENHG